MQLADQHVQGLANLLNDIASLLLDQSQSYLALELSQRAIAHASHSAAVLRNLGNVLHQDRQLDQAAQNKFSGTLLKILHTDRYSDAEVFRRHRDWGLGQISAANARLEQVYEKVRLRRIH